jgi:RNA polymerase sigma-70 factor (ECF subfamily)
MMRRGAVMSSDAEFERLVDGYYRPLYRFAYSLTRTEADAFDLCQQTFYAWAANGHQLRDMGKVKTWLFTTLYREFLNTRRREKRFPHFEIGQVEDELPPVSLTRVHEIDLAEVLRALSQVDEIFQAPLALFYLEECLYKEIAEILGIPIGTVKSRIARGLAQMHRLLNVESAVQPGRDAHD